MKPPPVYTPRHAFTSFTLRLPPACGSWLYGSAEQTSLSDLISGFIDDLRIWFGLGEIAANALEAKAKALHLDQREYLVRLLTQRAEAVRKHGAGWEKGQTAVLRAKRR